MSETGLEYPIKVSQVVYHPNRYGYGKVVSCNGKYVNVLFDFGLKRFEYPGAFAKGYLRVEGVDPKDFAVQNKEETKPSVHLNMSYAKSILANQYLVSLGWVYSIYDYFPSRYMYYNDHRNYRLLSEDVLKFKAGDIGAVEKFTDELCEAIEEIIRICEPKCPVWLIGVPSSQQENGSQTARSISQICKVLNDDKWSLGIPILDKTSVLRRIRSIPKSHLSYIRPSVDDQFKSLSFLCDEIPDEVLVILVDDIVTKGTTMTACRQVLSDGGIDKDNIIGLTICKTASDGVAKGLVGVKNYG